MWRGPAGWVGGRGGPAGLGGGAAGARLAGGGVSVGKRWCQSYRRFDGPPPLPPTPEEIRVR